jgi:WD40 repeat protein
VPRRLGARVLVTFFDYSTGRGLTAFQYNLRSPSDRVTSLAFSPAGNMLALGASDGTVTLLDVSAGFDDAKLVATIPVFKPAATDFSKPLPVAFDAFGKYLLVAEPDGTIRSWVVKTGGPFIGSQTPRVGSKPLDAIAVDHNNRYLLLAGAGAPPGRTRVDDSLRLK